MDREGRHKGGVLILVKNNIQAIGICVDTESQAEIHGVRLSIKGEDITIYNIYCPADKELSLQRLQTPQENCIVLGDFNSHSTNWGYNETDKRGDEVEDWQIDSKMLLLNDPEDPPSFYSRRWLTTSTPDLAFATDNVAKLTERRVLSQLGGSDHKPIKLSLDLDYSPYNPKTFPRWNYRKANWEAFATLTNQYTKSVKDNDQKINRATSNFNKAILKAAKETIPRGARKNYRPYWTQELQDLEDEVSKARQAAEIEPSTNNNITYKASEAKYRRAYKQAARASWTEKTEQLNLDRDGKKLWKLTKAMNDEDTRSAPITIEQNDKILSPKQAADCFIENYEETSSIDVPEGHRKQAQEELTTHGPESQEENMEKPFTETEFQLALAKLNPKKSPGPDRITNEMLQHLGIKAQRKLLNVINSSWKSGCVPQIWREADMIPVPKQGKDKKKVTNYRPISLLSCPGKLMEQMVNSRLMWHLEKNNILSPSQAGFRPHRSTEDQITYITQMIEDGFQEKKQTIAVWIDIEKAFEKVWKAGLKVKLKKAKVSGLMFQWICQYLNNRQARVHVNGSYSRKRILKHGVPQGGVLSPTLFLVFINDIVKELPRNVYGAIYADDMAIWCTEEYISTARYRIQEALTKIESWTKKWLIKINETKTTHTIFSLSTKNQKVTLELDGHPLPVEDNPTYLGVKFDRRLTWKPQIERAEIRAKKRLGLMKKLAGTTWGADTRTLKSLYVGRVRPVLEYGMAAWSTAAKSNLGKVNRIQNQATRIITGAMKSTPIQQLETITGLESLESRQDTKLLTQAAKFKRLPDHPMSTRILQPAKGRLKRTSFIQQSKMLEKTLDISNQTPQQLRCFTELPPWGNHSMPEIYCSIPGITKKESLRDTELKQYTSEHISTEYPRSIWTHIYTDGSAENAVKNGGAGIHICFPNGKEENVALPTGLNSTNYKAEATAIKIACDNVQNNPNTSNKIVLLSDAKSVLEALQSRKSNDLNDVLSSLALLSKYHTVVLQWIPSHCGVTGNEKADNLAKEGSMQSQENLPITLQEARTIIRAKQRERWLTKHPDYNIKDPYHRLNRSDQVIIFRLRTGHNRLNYHLHTKLKIGQTSQCPCLTGNMTAEHILQDCPRFSNLRKENWPQNQTVGLREKLYGSLESLQRTAAFAKATGTTI